MGIVWLARDEELERDVALKFLPDLMIQDRALSDQLKRETKRCLELTHPHIVRIHDFVHDETLRVHFDGVRRWRNPFKLARRERAKGLSTK